MPLPLHRAALAGLVLATGLGAAAHDGHVHAGDGTPSPAAATPSAARPSKDVSRGWPARVILDRRASLVVAAPEAGTVLAPPAGWPQAGRRVRAGELLAQLRPATRQTQRRDLESELVDARKDRALGALQIDRYGITDAQRFDISLPTQTLQILTDYDAARTRSTQLEAGLDGLIPIVATRAGRLLRVEADASQPVAAGAPLFAIASGDAALAIELRAADDGFVAAPTATAVLDGGVRLPLTRIASGYDGAARLHVALYAPPPGHDGLVVNQRLRVQFASPAALAAIP